MANIGKPKTNVKSMDNGKPTANVMSMRGLRS